MDADGYLRYYVAQHGGAIPVFRGSRTHQDGGGIGDILRGIWRWLAPVALRGVSSFAANTLKAHEEGKTLGEAAKSAIGPALGAAAKGAFPGQAGGGAAMSAAMAKKHGYAPISNEVGFPPFPSTHRPVRTGAVRRPRGGAKQSGRGGYKTPRKTSKKRTAAKRKPAAAKSKKRKAHKKSNTKRRGRAAQASSFIF